MSAKQCNATSDEWIRLFEGQKLLVNNWKVGFGWHVQAPHELSSAESSAPICPNISQTQFDSDISPCIKNPTAHNRCSCNHFCVHRCGCDTALLPYCRWIKKYHSTAWGNQECSPNGLPQLWASRCDWRLLSLKFSFHTKHALERIETLCGYALPHRLLTPHLRLLGREVCNSRDVYVLLVGNEPPHIMWDHLSSMRQLCPYLEMHVLFGLGGKNGWLPTTSAMAVSMSVALGYVSFMSRPDAWIETFIKLVWLLDLQHKPKLLCGVDPAP